MALRNADTRYGEKRRPLAMPAAAVADAAAAVDLQEYEFFRFAYWRRFGSQPRDRLLEHAFARYMLHEVVPDWVQSTVLEVLDRQHNDRLDPDGLGAGRFRDRPGRPANGLVYVAGFAAVWLFLFAALLETVAQDLPGPPRTYAHVPQVAIFGLSPQGER